MGKHNYLSLGEAESVVNKVFEELGTALTEERRIEIRGFGSFSVRNRASRIARNPRTGEKVNVASKKMPYFRAGKNIGKYLNK
tara:strand:+ start:230 stop:478 length:249 start_codon:yes stop_codon:yes gene_type:complete